MKAILQISINSLNRNFTTLIKESPQMKLLGKLFIVFTQLLTTFTILFAQDSLNVTSSTSFQKIQKEELNDYGTLWGWGYNQNGEVGNGTSELVSYPIQIGKDYNWKVLSISDNFTHAIKSDGTLWGWGQNSNGILGDGTTNSYSSPHQIGKEKYWSYISGSTRHCYAIKRDSSLWVWGFNEDGRFGDSTIPSDQYIALPHRVQENWEDVIFVGSGSGFSAAIRKGQGLYTWGLNNKGQLGDGTYISKNRPVRIGKTGEWSMVSCGYGHILAIKTDGTLWAWGNNRYGVLGDGTLAMRNSPIQIGTDNNWASVRALENWSFAIKTDGTLWAWGDNVYRAIGDTTIDLDEIHYPTQIGKDTDWKSVYGNGNFVGIKIDGSLWTWGAQNFSFTEQIFKVPIKLDNVSDAYKLSNNEGGGNILFIKQHISNLPEVVTLPIINISDSTAESGGNVTNDGKEWDCVRGICWGEKPNPTISDSITIDGQGAGKYQSSLKYLKPNTKYYVRAYATNSVGTAYGQEETFGSKLPTPLLVSPKNGNYNIPLDVTLCWKKVELAQGYRIQIFNSSTMISDVNIIDTSFKYDKYEPLNQYDWRVQTINGSDSSDWSELWSFATSKFYPAQLIKPVNDTINIPIDCELIWKENIAGSKYHLQFSKNPDFTKPDLDTTITETNFKLSKLDYLQLYNWRVRAKEGIDISEWSPIWKFTTLMDSVILTSPIDLSKNINISSAFNWQEGIYKKDYRLQISEADDFATTNTDTLISKFANADVKNLNYWQKYFWRVRNESGDTLGYWSEIWQFKTRMSDMLLMYPENTQTGLEQEINFKWYPVIGAEYYQLQISKNEQFTNMVYSKDSITTTEHFVPDLEKEILYYWRVRVWNEETIGTAYWSEVWTFRTGETSVKDESDAIQIIPNPAGDLITVDLKPSEGFEPSEGSEISIYNTLGECVMTESIHPMTASHRMNIQSLPKGIYFVKVGCETAKFVKL